MRERVGGFFPQETGVHTEITTGEERGQTDRHRHAGPARTSPARRRCTTRGTTTGTDTTTDIDSGHGTRRTWCGCAARAAGVDSSRDPDGRGCRGTSDTFPACRAWSRRSNWARRGWSGCRSVRTSRGSGATTSATVSWSGSVPTTRWSSSSTTCATGWSTGPTTGLGVSTSASRTPTPSPYRATRSRSRGTSHSSRRSRSIPTPDVEPQNDLRSPTTTTTVHGPRTTGTGVN